MPLPVLSWLGEAWLFGGFYRFGLAARARETGQRLDVNAFKPALFGVGHQDFPMLRWDAVALVLLARSLPALPGRAGISRDGAVKLDYRSMARVH